jgi:ornithine cyclodeaminase/alanine dehydrogenase-like protein (mu-crystallin family)
MFTEAQLANLGVVVMGGLFVLIPAMIGAGVSAFGAMKRVLDDIRQEQVRVAPIREETRENVSRMANGRGVQHDGGRRENDTPDCP